MKPYAVLLAAWMAAFGVAGVRSAVGMSGSGGPTLVALANVPSGSGFDSPLLEPEHRDGRAPSTPTPVVIHGPSYLSALRDYDVLSSKHRFSYGAWSGFKLHDHTGE
jgi:hypothetical protein